MSTRAAKIGCYRYLENKHQKTATIVIINFGNRIINRKNVISPEFTVQKLDYIHNNPVEAGIVDKPEEYLYSSARDYHNGKNCGLLKIVFL